MSTKQYLFKLFLFLLRHKNLLNLIYHKLQSAPSLICKMGKRGKEDVTKPECR